MSGSDKKRAANSGNATARASSKAMPMQTVQPFMPGMEEMLAQQLAAGFGGTPQSYTSAFDQTYAPMQVPDYSDWQGNPVPAVSAAPSMGSGDPNKHVMSDFERRWVQETYKPGDGFTEWLNTNPQLYDQWVDDKREAGQNTNFRYLVDMYKGQ
ncbi:hypothetical protein [Nitratireductor sp. CH_MIT9313-5]|uniref:hypothetical protein n=1 Tax=Nitratireductor sp. CH_MIT9313-5 TaxID=3107764 RepID=UPI00300AD559